MYFMVYIITKVHIGLNSMRIIFLNQFVLFIIWQVALKSTTQLNLLLFKSDVNKEAINNLALLEAWVFLFHLKRNFNLIVTFLICNFF
jgi:hypothetical protein